MKFFLDESFPRKATRMLESHGFEVFDIRGTEIEGADDTTLFEKTQQHEAIESIMSQLTDKKFLDLLFRTV